MESLEEKNLADEKIKSFEIRQVLSSFWKFVESLKMFMKKNKNFDGKKENFLTVEKFFMENSATHKKTFRLNLQKKSFSATLSIF